MPCGTMAFVVNENRQVFESSWATYFLWFYSHPLCSASLFLGGMCIFDAVERVGVRKEEDTIGNIRNEEIGSSTTEWKGVSGSNSDAAVNEMKTSSVAANPAVLACLGDLVFLCIIGLVLLPANRFPAILDDVCKHDACQRFITTGIAPVLFALWMFFSCYGSISARILSSPWCFTDIDIFCNPTLAMYLTQEPIAYFLARVRGGSFEEVSPSRPYTTLDKGTYGRTTGKLIMKTSYMHTQSPSEFVVLVGTVWTFSFLWSKTLERSLVLKLQSFLPHSGETKERTNTGGT